MKVSDQPDCRVINDTSKSSPFASCLQLKVMSLKAVQFFNACSYDATAVGKWTVCNNVAAMASVCRRFNHTINWTAECKSEQTISHSIPNNDKHTVILNTVPFGAPRVTATSAMAAENNKTTASPVRSNNVVQSPFLSTTVFSKKHNFFHSRI